MGRMAWAVRALVALTLLAAAAPASPKEPGTAKSPAGTAETTPGKHRKYTLDEVRILGSAEHPGVLFFLPRARFRLLPYRPEPDWKKRILLDDKGIAGE